MGLFAMGGIGLGMMPMMAFKMGKRGKSKCKPPPCHHHHHAQPPQFSSTIKYEGKISYS
ncbi:hypothetical protein [Pseudomonas shahriarae]|uniref:Uncharacterized protein n=1 Tax=Pseudomonas shahriarae TaxID=2745512 RepID=A0ABT5NHM8_9PSED|nr:hypothetical protein [Pseudomonas shahriarae]MDD0988050.1 hypothetical protein [Pseudomonas shahriarae]MDD1034649.1 hypothetical protein [Pseudomonas shahriarae]